MTALDLDLAFGHHLLAVPADVAPAEVQALAASWFVRPVRLAERALQLAADVVLTGPWSLAPEDAAALGLSPGDAAAVGLADEGAAAVGLADEGGTEVFLLRCPVLRGGPPPSELVHPAGLTGAFPDGVPEGVEAQALEFLLATARRLGGAVRIAGSGAILAPDPDAEVNLLVHSPVWLDPDALLAACRPALPTLRLAMELDEAPSPRSTSAPPVVTTDAALDAGERSWLHAEANAFDEAALAHPPVFVAYGAVAELGEDGLVEVAVEGEETVPLALHGLDWVQRGVVVYLVRWWPHEEVAPAAAGLSAELPPAVRAMRARARAVVERTAVALFAAAGGEITDESGFLVDPAALSRPDE